MCANCTGHVNITVRKTPSKAVPVCFDPNGDHSHLSDLTNIDLGSPDSIPDCDQSAILSSQATASCLDVALSDLSDPDEEETTEKQNLVKVCNCKKSPKESCLFAKLQR